MQHLHHTIVDLLKKICLLTTLVKEKVPTVVPKCVMQAISLVRGIKLEC